jgi:nitroreductase
MNSASVPGSDRPVAAAFAEAAEMAGLAPSFHNTQPWRWRVGSDALDLYADTTRALPATDPEGRMLAISCGAALHHARTALAAEGYEASVQTFPSPDLPTHLARVTVSGARPVSAEAIRLVQAIDMRHTDRRPTLDIPVTAAQLETLRQVAEAEGVHLHRLTDDQVTEFAVAVSHADDAAAADPALQAETARWTGGTRPEGTGLPDAVIPSRRPETDVGERDFGTTGSLPIGGEHDKASAYAVLFGETDDREGWLRAGQAMSAVWLRATELGLAVLPFSQVVEVVSTRVLMRQMLAELGHAYIVLRLGLADPDHSGPPHTPRLQFSQIVEYTDDARAGRPTA